MKKSIITICICVASVALVALVAHWRSTLPPVRFLNQPTEYHERFAIACGEVLALNPIGTNLFISLPVSGMPDIIADLSPSEFSKITISSNRFHMLIGAGRLGFGVSWEPSKSNPNVWELWHHWEGDSSGPLFASNGNKIGQQEIPLLGFDPSK